MVRTIVAVPIAIKKGTAATAFAPVSGNAVRQAMDLRKKIRRAEAAVARRNWSLALDLWHDILLQADQNMLLTGRAKTNISIISRLADLPRYRAEIDRYCADIHGRKPRIAVFTANVGSYDALRLPEVINSNFEYVLFSDHPANGGGIWSFREISYVHSDSTRVARFVKTHPHLLLSDFDYAVWLDSNIMIVGDIVPIVQEFIDSGKLIGAVAHPDRMTVYEEMRACVLSNRDDPEIMERQVGGYKDAGFVHDDLIESNFLIYNLTNEKTHAFADAWWDEIDRHSKRDQLSINYVLRAHGIDWHRLLKWPQSARNHPALAFGFHGQLDAALAQILLSALDCGACDTPVADRSRKLAAPTCPLGKGTTDTATSTGSGVKSFLGRFATLLISSPWKTAERLSQALKVRQRLRRERRLVAASGLFDAEWYTVQNPDVMAVGLDPLDHFLLFGGKEGRAPSPAFDSNAYLRAHADVASAGLNPLVHYLVHGQGKGGNNASSR